MEKTKILAFAGSTRKDSFNKKLVNLTAGLAEVAGAEVQLIDLANFRLPLYDGDEEAADGMPAKAAELKRMMAASHGFIIASPEYNGSLSAVLKNTIDWVSRPGGTEESAFRGKTALIVAASPGGLGGLRGLRHLREVLGNLGTLVVPEQHAVSKAYEAFTEDGVSDSVREKVGPMVESFVDRTSRLR